MRERSHACVLTVKNCKSHGTLRVSAPLSSLTRPPSSSCQLSVCPSLFLIPAFSPPYSRQLSTDFRPRGERMEPSSLLLLQECSWCRDWRKRKSCCCIIFHSSAHKSQSSNTINFFVSIMLSIWFDDDDDLFGLY